MRKSSYSQGKRELLEVAFLDDGAVAVRDSRIGRPALLFHRWSGSFSAGMTAENSSTRSPNEQARLSAMRERAS